ncbi:hypothetical protein CC78DRAFT_578313 [Lojkania enalia]|uniref:Probable double zinc ribbon domain-containing protein n=1 Tax=Lojkania enalia TaxID=147567 RepID=A0A9P4KCQ5_9PLEO|nr:hypothetical protein CC78DRAFT_578313 [Didymosphaeria enalia]
MSGTFRMKNQIKPVKRDRERIETVKARIAHLEQKAREQLRRESQDEYDGIVHDTVYHIWRSTRKDVDGIWRCEKCNLENEIVKIPGKYPLGFLQCRLCKETWSPRCVTTNVLKHAHLIANDELSLPFYKSKDNPHGVICGDCGLSVRALPDINDREVLTSSTRINLAFPSSCPCGAHWSPSWIYFRIDDNSDYRYGDPDVTYAASLEQCLSISMEKLENSGNVGVVCQETRARELRHSGQISVRSSIYARANLLYTALPYDKSYFSKYKRNQIAPCLGFTRPIQAY